MSRKKMAENLSRSGSGFGSGSESGRFQKSDPDPKHETTTGTVVWGKWSVLELESEPSILTSRSCTKIDRLLNTAFMLDSTVIFSISTGTVSVHGCIKVLISSDYVDNIP
jgi:hypothetical protein